MPINLQKGQKVSLTKDNPGLSKIVVGLGWDVNAFDTGGDFDLDTSAFLLTDAGKVSRPEDFVFYQNLQHPWDAPSIWGITGQGQGTGMTSRSGWICPWSRQTLRRLHLP